MKPKNILLVLCLSMVLTAVLAFAASSISINSITIPTSISQGDTFNIIMSVSGSTVDTVSGSLTLPSGISCTPTGSQSISLDASGTGSATWSCSASISGDYSNMITASVSAKDTGTGQMLSDSKQTGLSVLSPASLTASSVISHSSRPSGATAIFTVGVNNVGDSSTTYSLVCLSSSASATCTPSSTSSASISGNSLATTAFTITGVSTGTATITATVSSPTQSDITASQTITITAAVSPGNEDSGGGGGGASGGASDNKKNVTHKPVPPGLVNNTKLQAAIEKVLAKGKMNQNAIDNLMRLSAQIAGESTISRTINSGSSKSNVTTKIKYVGAKVAKNFVVYEKVPKTFANSSDLITVTAAGAKVEVVQKDPEYAIMFDTVNPNQELEIIYSVNKLVSTNTVNSFASEVYAESLVEAQAQQTVCAQVITPARNEATGECKEFTTPCDVPAGWVNVDSCKTAGVSADNTTKKITEQQEGSGSASGSTILLILITLVVLVAGYFFFKNGGYENIVARMKQ